MLRRKDKKRGGRNRGGDSPKEVRTKTTKFGL